MLASPLLQACCHSFWHPPALHQAGPLVWDGQSPPCQAGLSPSATTPGTPPVRGQGDRCRDSGTLLTGTCRSGGGLFSGATVSTQVIFSMSTEPFLLPRRCKRVLVQMVTKGRPGETQTPLPVQPPLGLCAGKGQLVTLAWHSPCGCRLTPRSKSYS